MNFSSIVTCERCLCELFMLCNVAYITPPTYITSVTSRYVGSAVLHIESVARGANRDFPKCRGGGGGGAKVYAMYELFKSLGGANVPHPATLMKPCSVNLPILLASLISFIHFSFPPPPPLPSPPLPSFTP